MRRPTPTVCCAPISKIAAEGGGRRRHETGAIRRCGSSDWTMNDITRGVEIPMTTPTGTRITRRAAVASGLALAATRAVPARAADMEIRFYYPIAVSGPITKIIDSYAADFERENPGVKIKPIYAGDYVQTIGKALIAMKGGDIPECAILLAADIITLTDENAVIPLDDLVKTAEDKAWLESFYPAFMENARLKGKTYAVPFQRS